MHRVIRDHLEEVLREEAREGDPIRLHLRECEECSGEIAAMRGQARELRQLRADVEPRPGFYARVRERIEAQGATSIWNVFFESAFGRRLALASMTLALALGIYLVTSEQMAEQMAEQTPATRTVQFVPGEDQPGTVLIQSGKAASSLPDRDSVLVNLVTYREQ
jgi:hypothetical protein